ncbi:hypothetical protein [Sphingomonas asaccharolytica]|uniref:hypothetical protein n=1 Tax=Sphingomonas asaccharolytica TaxID=40681 RepID=UPI0012ED5A59|nr:hypothetical protein [Sphingomonas asaccharolytica]
MSTWRRPDPVRGRIFYAATYPRQPRGKGSALKEKLFRSSSGNFVTSYAFSVARKIADGLEFTVKVLPFVFALVPLVAVVSACVSTY